MTTQLDPRYQEGTPMTAREVLLAYSNGWHGANCEGNFRLSAACSCGLADQLTKVEEEAVATLSMRLPDIAVMALGEVTTGSAYALYHKSFREHFVARLARIAAYRSLGEPPGQRDAALGRAGTAVAPR